MLIRRGADSWAKTRMGNIQCDFIACAFVWGHRDMLWELIDDIVSTSSFELNKIWVRLSEDAERMISFSATARIWHICFNLQKRPKSLSDGDSRGSISRITRANTAFLE